MINTTMATPEDVKISLKYVVDTEKNQVVYVEAGNSFVDSLLSFLTLPVGTVIRLINNHSGDQLQPPALGSLTSLYQGLVNLPTEYFRSESCKAILAYPRNSSEAELRKLVLNVDDTVFPKYIMCKIFHLSSRNTLKCILCGQLVFKEIKFKSCQSEAGVFVSERASFIVSDNLQILPNLPGSSIHLLNHLGIRDMEVLEEKTEIIGIKEMLALLKISLFSRTPLTDLFLRKGKMLSQAFCSKPAKPILVQDDATNSRKMTLKLVVQKSISKVILAQAGEDFVDFIFGVLAIPLGTLADLRGDVALGSIGSLHKSISNLEAARYLKSELIKDKLMHPRLPAFYLYKNNLLNIKQAEATWGCLHSSTIVNNQRQYHLAECDWPCAELYTRSRIRIPDPNVNGDYVQGPAMFEVSDDLVVTPSFTTSSFSFLKSLKIPLSDIEEHVIKVGAVDALNIVRASLNTTSALTSGLNLQQLKKPKLEK